MQEEAVSAAVDWLVQAALAGSSQGELLQGICDRFVAGGLPLKRVAAGSGLLHPTIDSRGFRWARGETVQREEYFHDRVSMDDWEKSPFRTLVEGNERSMRRRLDGDYRVGEYELLDNLKAAGSTDYYAVIHRHGDPTVSGKLGDFVSSWTIDRPGGYSDTEIAQIERVASAFALSYQSRSMHGTIRTLLETYLGRGAAQRVLLGNINRGQADAIETVIWYSDLAHFTRIADEVEREHLLSFLNEYAACLVESIEAHDGEVLKFIGDGILAIFNEDDLGIARSNALDAAFRAEEKIAALNESRLAQGVRTTDFYLALHVGDLLFGNFGSTNRLDFTVLGPAVNEASRIGGMCRSLDQRVIVSSAFAEAAGPRRRDLVSLGRYALRGVGQPQELFTIDRSARRAS
ncbi:adenylate/guanylate cyclase domain-containing protein [Dongia sedimenti]|uniref:Adenylate/guanylate cyclase domain-containing protein n=1 Tax=Dongia sedimenti TaxID=3064282 RepID=A0ABU0YLJ4_9PROT|nr:adenylate/guanylate cyclase domain-containing protein [Rhodospirillaceae bacterium R-7]